LMNVTDLLVIVIDILNSAAKSIQPNLEV
jgi:hypothetical protein